MKQFKPIDGYRKASSCKSRWEDMKGTEQVRFCEKCKLQVYNFSKMELPEAEAFIFQREGRKNATLYKRDDGKFLASDCPVGRRQRQTRMVFAITSAVAALALVALILIFPPPVPKPSGEPAGSTHKEAQLSGTKLPTGSTVTQTVPGGGVIEVILPSKVKSATQGQHQTYTGMSQPTDRSALASPLSAPGYAQHATTAAQDQSRSGQQGKVNNLTSPASAGGSAPFPGASNAASPPTQRPETLSPDGASKQRSLPVQPQTTSDQPPGQTHSAGQTEELWDNEHRNQAPVVQYLRKSK